MPISDVNCNFSTDVEMQYKSLIIIIIIIIEPGL
jgi:hypothetical protein